jgi:NAD(P)-dependent dehydrogenase (short-subunit alcohol dehydrogenase family)
VSTETIDLDGLFRLDGRTALVTGASAGLGHRFARVLDAAGARVVLVARRKDRLEDLAAELDDPLVVPADLAAPGVPADVIARVADALGPVDVLVNNVGITTPMPAEAESPELFRASMHLNVDVPFQLAQACARLAWDAQRPLSVINIASVLGLSASRSVPQAAYTASKGALVNLTRELANQWARRSVRVNALAPGWFPSEITSAEMIDKPEGANFIRRNTPMGRAGRTGELDGALLYLAADASSYTTGHVLIVDGGWTII